MISLQAWLGEDYHSALLTKENSMRGDSYLPDDQTVLKILKKV